MAYVPNERNIQLEGFAELEQQLLQLSQIGRADLVARNTMVKAAKIAMEPVYYRVLEKAPYDETNNGPIHLRDTVRLDARIPNGRDRMSKYVEDTDAAIAVVSVKKSAVSLAQEFGTSKMPFGNPFLRPAIDHLANEVIRKLGNELGSFITEYAKKLNRKRT